MYNPSGNVVTTLDDDTGETYTAGSAFDAEGNFYVTDDLVGDISEFGPNGDLMSTFATGLTNPLSLVFDNKGNLYAGQQGTPYIADFTATGRRLADIGPVNTGESGDDWIDLSRDQCTFYYTTETDQIFRYNKCSNTQLSNFNASALPGPNAYELRILDNHDVLVADSTAVYLLDSGGNIIQTYPCSSMPGCSNGLLSIAVDPSGTSFWTGDNFSGLFYQIDMSTGQVMETINAQTAALFGLSVAGEPEAAAGVPEGGVLTAAESYDGGAGTECPCLSTNGHHGEPVNPMNGDFYENDTDLTVPGPGVGLGFSRNYDAMAAQSGVTSPLGPGWTDNLNMSVALNPTTSVATVTESNGAQVTFEPYDASTPWCRTSKNYCPTAPRDIATLNHSGDGSWTFTDNLSTPVTYLFASSGGLEQITNAVGQSIAGSPEAPGTGTGSSACPTGAGSCTVWLSNAATPNPTLTEVLNAAGQLIQVNGFATSGGTPPSVTFCYYGETACGPPSSGGNAGSLYSVTDPGGLTTTYTYDATNGTTQYQDDLLTRTDPDGHQLVNTYNTSGQIAQQNDPNGAVSTYSYAETAGVAPGDGIGNATTVSDAQGTGLPATVTQYTYTYGELIATTVDPVSSSPSVTISVRSPVTGQIVTAIDPNGSTSNTTLPNPNSSGNSYLTDIDPTETTDALGNTTRYAYTASNQVWCQVAPAEVANGVTCPGTEPTTAPTPGAENTVDLGATITYFDAAGNPTYVTDPLGNTTQTAYTSSELPFCQVDAAEFTTAGKSCPATPPANPPTGTVTGYTTTLYSAAGNKTSVTTPLGATTTYSYTNASYPNTATSSTDPEANVTSTTLDGAGRPTLVSLSFGSFVATTAYAYDAAGRRYCDVEPDDYALGERCPSTAPTSSPAPGSDPWPGASITIFNGSGQPLYKVNPLGGVTQTAYDGAGRPYCTVSPADYAQGISCPAVGQPWGSGITLTVYDAFGRAVQVTNPLGGLTATGYDAAGNVTQTTVESNLPNAAPNVVTQYSYDADNRVTTTTVDPGGGTLQSETEQAYDPNGNAFCSVSANATASGNFQCPPWQSAWIATPPSPSSLYSSTPNAAQANNVTTTFFDADGNQVQSTNGDVETTLTSYDADGRSACTVDPTNVAAGHTCPSPLPTTPPAQGTDPWPGTTVTVFDANGNTLSSTDQVGDTTLYSYDAAGNVLTTTDPRSKVTTNCYYDENGSGQCANGAPSGGGSGNDLYYSINPSTGSNAWGALTTYTYFAGGQHDVTSSWSGTTTDGVAANGELTSVTYSNTAAGYSVPANVTYTFNQDDTRHTMTDGTGTTTYSYDDNGDVTSQALVAASGSGLANTTTSHGYYSTGVLASITYPSYTGHTSPQVTYAYDATGAMKSETDWLGNQVTFGHDGDSNATAQNNNVSTTNPSGTSSTSFSYDGADQNTSATSTINQTCGASENLTQSFSGSTGSRNADGQLTQYKSTYSTSCSGQGSTQVNYSYDPAGRVVYQGSSAQGSNANNFAYDASGDPTTISSHASSGGSLDTYAQSFDNAGEVTGQSPITGSGGSSSTYSYDMVGNQTQSVSGPSTDQASFNQTGQMTGATTASSSAGYLYDGDGLEAAASTSTGAPTWGSPTGITFGSNAISCPSSTFCMAVGGAGIVSMFNNGSWTTSVPDTRTLNAVSCTSSTFCVAVDSGGYAIMYNGSTWSTPTGVGYGSTNAVSCTSSIFCVAVGTLGLAAVYNGSTWSVTQPDSTRTLDAVTCVTSSFCQAVDTSGYAVKYSGSWGAPSDIDGSRSLDTVTCTSTVLCVAGGASGYASMYNALSGTWSSASDIDASRTIKAAACTTTSFCVAVDTSGYATVYNGSSWSSPSDIDGAHALEAVSCASASACTASDNDGNVVSYSGGSWSSPVGMDSTRSVGAIACPSVVFCAVADGSGYAVVFQPLSMTTSQLTWDANSSLSSVISDGANDYVYGPSATPVEEVSLSSSTPTYLAYSPANDTWLSTNAAGDQTGFWSYDAFGTPAFGTSTSAFGYSGQYSDTTTSLVNDRARWYEPQTGGFTTRDPAFASTNTAYSYAGDDPVNASDPTGEMIGPGPTPKIDIYLNDPYALEGMNPPDLLHSIGGVPEGWQVSSGRGHSVAPGWKLFEMNSSDEAPAPTGLQIRWGASLRADHPDGWYWTVSNGSTRTTAIRAGNWPGGPEEYVGGTGGVLNRSSGQGEGGDEIPQGPTNPCITSYSSGSAGALLIDCTGGEGDIGGGGIGGGEPEPEPEPIGIPASYNTTLVPMRCPGSTDPVILV